jgi:hypothetical protein
MTRKKQIDEVAKEKYDTAPFFIQSNRDKIKFFTKGAEWADANPDPAREAAIQKLLKALEKAKTCIGFGGKENQIAAMKWCEDALEAWKDANK